MLQACKFTQEAHHQSREKSFCLHPYLFPSGSQDVHPRMLPQDLRAHAAEHGGGHEAGEDDRPLEDWRGLKGLLTMLRGKT